MAVRPLNTAGDQNSLGQNAGDRGGDISLWIYSEGRACRICSWIGYGIQEGWKVVINHGWICQVNTKKENSKRTKGMCKVAIVRWPMEWKQKQQSDDMRGRRTSER